jgi:hypothetical protein
METSAPSLPTPYQTAAPQCRSAAVRPQSSAACRSAVPLDPFRPAVIRATPLPRTSGRPCRRAAVPPLSQLSVSGEWVIMVHLVVPPFVVHLVVPLLLRVLMVLVWLGVRVGLG